MRHIPAAALLGLLSACTTAPDGARQILPDDRLLVQQNTDASLARVVGEPSDYAALTAQLVVESNARIGFVLALVDAVTAFPPTLSNADGTELLWGPWQDDGQELQLGLGTQADGHHTWGIELRPVGTSDWIDVLGGEVEPGATAESSNGWFALDFDALNAAGAGDGTTGALAVEYALREQGATTTVFLGAFAEGDAIPADAATHFDYDEGRGGSMDVVVQQDLSDPPNGVAESWGVRSQWTETGAGRADALLTGGDFGVLTFIEQECWDAVGSVTYFQNNFTLEQSGDESDCAFDAPSE